MEIDWNLVIGATSSITAVCAFVLTWYQVIATREHKKFSVKPILRINPFFDHISKAFTTELVNEGLGRAIITKSKLIFHGKTQESKHTELQEEAAKILFPGSLYQLTTGQVNKRSVVKSGEIFTI